MEEVISRVKKDDSPRINYEIKSPEVRLIDENNNMLGVINVREALKRAQQAKLDLVEVSPDASPPVCKIINYSKFNYEKQKKLKEAKKKQVKIILKEVKFRPNIGEGDFDTKVKHVIEFLQSNNKVKISLRFRGREITHKELGFELFNKIKDLTAEYCKIELAPKMEGMQLVMILAPIIVNKQ